MSRVTLSLNWNLRKSCFVLAKLTTTKIVKWKRSKRMKKPPAKVVYDNKLKIVEEMRRSRENPKNLKRKIVYQYRMSSSSTWVRLRNLDALCIAVWNVHGALATTRRCRAVMFPDKTCINTLRWGAHKILLWNGKKINFLKYLRH